VVPSWVCAILETLGAILSMGFARELRKRSVHDPDARDGALAVPAEIASRSIGLWSFLG
jgi:hypothetical protein